MQYEPKEGCLLITAWAGQQPIMCFPLFWNWWLFLKGSFDCLPLLLTSLPLYLWGLPDRGSVLYCLNNHLSPVSDYQGSHLPIKQQTVAITAHQVSFHWSPDGHCQAQTLVVTWLQGGRRPFEKTAVNENWVTLQLFQKQIKVNICKANLYCKQHFCIKLVFGQENYIFRNKNS